MVTGGVRVVQSASHGRLIQAAADFIARQDEVLVVLPHNGASEGVLRLPKGAAGVHQRPLAQLASELARTAMAELGLAPLSGLGGEALLARVVFEARRSGALGYFSPVAGLPGFVRALARTVRELRLARTASAELEGTGPAGTDLARLLAAYENELKAGSLVDLARILELATAAAERGRHRLLGLPVVWLDAPLEWIAQRDFFRALTAQAPCGLAAVSRWRAPGAPAGAGAEDLDAGQPSGPLEHLRRNLFVPAPAALPAEPAGGRFQFFSAPGEGLEAVEIARRILALAGEGVAFDQVAILLRAPERYQPMVEEALGRAGIPAHFSRGVRRPDPAGRAFLALLACAAEEVSASRFAEYMSLGQVPRPEAAPGWVPPEDEVLAAGAAPPAEASASADAEPARSPRAPAAWEKLLVDAAVIGGLERWERRLSGLEAEFELRLAALAAEDVQREQQSRQLELLRALKSFALPLVEALGALPRGAAWGVWIEKLSALARQSLHDPEGVLAALAELTPMAEVGPVSLEEVRIALSERLRFLRREPARRRWGSVLVCSIEEARSREFAVVFLPGLAEGLFPPRTSEDPLLLDAFRSALEGLPLRDDLVRQERALLHLASGAARDRLIVSYPRMDVAAARPRVPSFYALELPRALTGTLPDVDTFERQAREAAPARLNRPGPTVPEAAIDDAEYDLVALGPEGTPEGAPKATGKARYLVEASEYLGRSLRARWVRWHASWKEADGLIVSDAGGLDALAAHRLAARIWSASSLEKFAACPYKFALHGIHRLQPREESAPLEQLDPLTRGALFHEVQFKLLAELKAAGMLPIAEDRLAEILTRAERALDRVAEEYQERLAPAIPRVWAAEIEDLRTDLRGWLQHTARDDADWDPVHFEFAFGLNEDLRKAERDPASTDREAPLEEGVRLRGSIDLVERHRARGVYRVTDHKTGKAPELPPHWVGGGRALQPVLYALAVEKLLGATVESGRLYYCTQRGEFRPMEVKVTPQARGALKRLLEAVDGAIGGGFLPPYPEQKACSICDYRLVCGPYEERRAAGKNRADERLEPLVEIRGMA